MNQKTQSFNISAFLPFTKENKTTGTTIPCDQLIYHGDEQRREQWLIGIERIRVQMNQGASFNCEFFERVEVSDSEEIYKLIHQLLEYEMVEELSEFFLGRKLQIDLLSTVGDEVVLPAHRKLPKTLLRKLVMVYFPCWEVQVCPCREHQWLDEFVHFWLPVLNCIGPISDVKASPI
jgi:hypothetical protein